MLTKVKTALRISHAALDEEIQDLINAAKSDLILSGVTSTKANVETDALIIRAVTTYVKAHFGYDNPDADKLLNAYEMIKGHLSSSIDYAYYTVTFNLGAQKEVIFDGTIKQTDATGQALFYSREQNHVPYIIDGVTSYTDIKGNTIIGA